MTHEEIVGRFKRKRFGLLYFAGFSAIHLSGYGLLWYETNWKTALAVFLIAYGVLLQAHYTFVTDWRKDDLVALPVIPTAILVVGCVIYMVINWSEEK